jgi:hypothetical protein
VETENKVIYFDTSTWNHLQAHDEREQLTRIIHRRNERVLASVISLGQILCTTNDHDRQKLCETMRTLHGDGPLLSSPFSLARAAAQGVLQEQDDFSLPRNDRSDHLLGGMLDATPPIAESWLKDWLKDREIELKEISAALKPLHLKQDLNRLPEVLDNDAFLKILCRLPPAKDLGVTVSQMRSIREKSDVWKALGGTLAYMIKPSTIDAPNYKRSEIRPSAKRKVAPDAADLWQAPYLGVVDVFVTGDFRMLDAISEISSASLVRYRRCTELSNSFFDRLLSAGK